LQGGPAPGCPVDQAYLNALLYVHEAFERNPMDFALRQAIAVLESWLRECEGHCPEPQPMGPLFDGLAVPWKRESPCQGVVILAPTPRSLFALLLIAVFNLLGFRPALIVIRAFSFSRFQEEWQREGKSLLRKIWRKLILQSDEYPEKGRVSLRSLGEVFIEGPWHLGMQAQRLGIPCCTVNRFEEAIPTIAKHNGQIAIFTGGGLVNSSLLQAIPRGVVNVHMGSLPSHKGMDAIFAALLEGYFGEVALTAHLMEARVDRGPCLLYTS
ncbi:MAG: formyltransferase family protein, partial [Deltaproteobacteria bacterium]|nr:formyltransferase family protein [Deltaproteobacteria bacterium]